MSLTLTTFILPWHTDSNECSNPSLRSPVHPPPLAYPFMRGLSMNGRRPPSWAENWDPIKQEYAVTIASGSSIAGEC